jgi:hypothetical protein
LGPTVRSHCLGLKILTLIPFGVGIMDLRKEWLIDKKENGIKQGNKKSI